jgi:cobalt-zinc-cadmium efflux system protein
MLGALGSFRRSHMHDDFHLDCACGEAQGAGSALGDKFRVLWVALVLVATFSLAELGAGLFSHSLALQAEAVHLISDSVSLALALLATWIAQWPASDQAPFGYRRVEVLAALVNGLGLMAIAFWLIWEAIERFQAPADEILSIPMLITAGVGLVVNTVNASLLHGHSHHDLNLKGAFLHMVADAAGSVGVIIAALLIWSLGWTWADSSVSLLVAGLIVVGTVPLIRQSLHILLEKTPSQLDLEKIRLHLLTLPGVAELGTVKVWAIAPNHLLLSAQIKTTLNEAESRDRLLQTLKASLKTSFGMDETLLEISAAAPALNLSIPPRLESLCTLESSESDEELASRF